MIQLLYKKYKQLREDREWALRNPNDFKESGFHFKVLQNQDRNKILEFNMSDNFNVRRIIVGKHGCGKTTLIRKIIIPKLHDYFVIDLCHEYLDIPNDRKYVACGDPERDTDNVCRYIQKNEHRTIILDNFGMIGTGQEKGIYDFLRAEKSNFIVVVQSANALKYIMDMADYVFKFETFDKIESGLLVNHPDKFIDVKRLK